MKIAIYSVLDDDWTLYVALMSRGRPFSGENTSLILISYIRELTLKR